MTLFTDIMATDGSPVLDGHNGETVTHHPDGGSDAALVMIFAATPAEFTPASPGGMSDVRTGTLVVRKAVLATVSRKDKVTLRGAKWAVVTVDDLEHSWRLNIRRSERIESAPGDLRQPRV